MKNYRIILFAFAILGLFLTSCDTDDELLEPSSITYLPKITLEGSTNLVLDCNTESYTDPGAIAEAAGSEIELNTSVQGIYFGGNTIDGPDKYSVTYSALNEDGIPAAAFRTVIWPACNGDMVNSIEGMYTASILRTTVSTGGTVNFTSSAFGPYFIIDLGGGVYQLSDAIGGFYEHGYGYGPGYAAKGMTVTANDISANDFTHNDVIGVGAFGGAAKITSFSVNPAAKTIKFTTSWSFGYIFEVTLTQVPQ